MGGTRGKPEGAAEQRPAPIELRLRRYLCGPPAAVARRMPRQARAQGREHPRETPSRAPQESTAVAGLIPASTGRIFIVGCSKGPRIEFVVFDRRTIRHVDNGFITAPTNVAGFGVETNGHTVTYAELRIEHLLFGRPLIQFSNSHNKPGIM